MKGKRRVRWGRLLFVLFVLLIVTAGFLLYFKVIKIPNLFSSNAVQNGDTISVDYVGKLEDGTVFDTSIESVALENNLQTSPRTYKPLEFTVGSGQMILGFENAVLGMKPGQEKTITLQPEEAYGTTDEKKIIEIPRVQEINRTVIINRTTEIGLQQFVSLFGKQPETNEIIESKLAPWKIKVLSYTQNSVLVENLPEKGQIISLPQTQWNSTVVDIDENIITLSQDPENGQIIETPFGEDEIFVNRDTIKIKSNPREGETIQTLAGPAKISKVTEDTVTVDFNHQLAGKTLIFTIKLLNVQKKLSP